MYRYPVMWLVPALCLCLGLVMPDVLRVSAAEAHVTLPPIVVTAPGCEWGGPYPGLVKGTEMWIVICAEGEGDG